VDASTAAATASSRLAAAATSTRELGRRRRFGGMLWTAMLCLVHHACARTGPGTRLWFDLSESGKVENALDALAPPATADAGLVAAVQKLGYLSPLQGTSAPLKLALNGNAADLTAIWAARTSSRASFILATM
jgi:hypothetical protein